MAEKRSGKQTGGGRRSGSIRESEHGIRRPRPSGAPEIHQQAPRPNPGGGNKGGGKGSNN